MAMLSEMYKKPMEEMKGLLLAQQQPSKFAGSVPCNHSHMAQHSCTGILHLVESMHARIPAVLKAKGGTACY